MPDQKCTVRKIFIKEHQVKNTGCGVNGPAPTLPTESTFTHTHGRKDRAGFDQAAGGAVSRRRAHAPASGRGAVGNRGLHHPLPGAQFPHLQNGEEKKL